MGAVRRRGLAVLVVKMSGKGGRRGKGGKGGSGGKGGKGGGGSNWGNPAWRAAKLAEMEAKRPRVAIDEHKMGARIASWANSSGPDAEMRLEENYGREGVGIIQKICQQLSDGGSAGLPRLYAQSYGKGRNTIVVVAKRPLPSYRADLDTRHGRREANLFLSRQNEAMLEGVLSDLDAHSSTSLSERARSRPPPHASPPPRPSEKRFPQNELCVQIYAFEQNSAESLFFQMLQI